MRYLGTILVVGCLALSACGPNLADPIFRKFSTANLESVSMDAHQRAIITTTYAEDGGRTRTIYCAEPSPDAFASISRTIAGSLSSGTEAQRKFAADLGISLVTQASDDLSARNATIQLLRDGLYRACEAFASGALPENEYVGIVGQYQNVILALLSIEFLTNVNRDMERASSIHSGDLDPAGDKSETLGGTGPPEAQGEVGADDKKASDRASSAAQTEAVTSYAPLSDTAIEKLADTANAMVRRVLSTERARALQPRLTECLRLTEPQGIVGKFKLDWCDKIFQRIVGTGSGITDGIIGALESSPEHIAIGMVQHFDMAEDEISRIFKFEISEEGSFTISVSARTRGSGDPAIILTSVDGGVLGTDDDSGQGLDALLEQTLKVGDYELHVLNVGRDDADFDLLIDRHVPEGSPTRDDIAGDDEAARGAQA